MFTLVSLRWTQNRSLNFSTHFRVCRKPRPHDADTEIWKVFSSDLRADTLHTSVWFSDGEESPENLADTINDVMPSDDCCNESWKSQRSVLRVMNGPVKFSANDRKENWNSVPYVERRDFREFTANQLRELHSL